MSREVNRHISRKIVATRRFSPIGDRSTVIPPSCVRKATHCSTIHSTAAHECGSHLFTQLTHRPYCQSAHREPYSRLFSRARSQFRSSRVPRRCVMTIPFICGIWGTLGRCYRSCESLYTLMSQSSAKMLSCPHFHF